MKVSELIEALKTMPPELEVNTEGCDCYGDVGRVELKPEEKYTLTAVNLDGTHGPKTEKTEPAYVILWRSEST